VLREAAATPNTKRTQRLRGVCVIEPRNDEIAGAEAVTYGRAFSAAMQLAALAAVVSYFGADLRELAVNSITAAGRGNFRSPYFQFSLWIVFARGPRK
jgi:undecaprenyl pyrophosphate phosphatase UppP